jgi:hypothetical protein
LQGLRALARACGVPLQGSATPLPPALILPALPAPPAPRP